MATNTTKKRNIRYLSRDFEGYKNDLLKHLEIYFPNDYKDFNESSVGLLLTELVSYIGDNMSFYLDKKFQESFIQTAQERKNIFKHAKQLGFKAFGKTAATGTVDAFLKVPAKTENGEIKPDMSFAGTIKRRAKLKSESGEVYETIDDIDFSEVDISDSTRVAVGDRDPQTEQPTSFVLRKTGIDIKAGETKTTTFTVGSYESFRTLTLSDEDVLEVVSIVDSEKNEWFEVDFLAQDTVFSSEVNTGADSDDVPYVLKLKSVPYRFVTEYDIDANKMSIVFGTGDAQNFDGDLIPDLGDLSLPVFGKETFTDFTLDPQNFLKTRTLGLSPVDTTLTVKYRVGGGEVTNAATGKINTVVDSVFDVGDTTLNQNTVREVGNSFSIKNESPVQGGKDEMPIEEIRELISADHAAQSRAVTRSDFIARTLSMPAKFGSVFRVSAHVNPLNSKAVELNILSRNSLGHVTTAPGDLKTNLKRYLSRFRMFTDAIEILDGEIVNVAIGFSVLTNPEFNKSEVLANAIISLKEFFNVEKWSMNQPINITDIYRIVSDVPGVLSLISLDVFNRVANYDGRSYSNTIYNIEENTKNGIIYCKENSIFEVKYLDKDIFGTAR